MAYGMIVKGAVVGKFATTPLNGSGQPVNPCIKQLPTNADVGSYDINIQAGTFGTMVHIQLISGHNYTVNSVAYTKSAAQFMDEIWLVAVDAVAKKNWASVTLTEAERALLAYGKKDLPYKYWDSLWSLFPPAVPASS